MKKIILKLHVLLITSVVSASVVVASPTGGVGSGCNGDYSGIDGLPGMIIQLPLLNANANTQTNHNDTATVGDFLENEQTQEFNNNNNENAPINEQAQEPFVELLINARDPFQLTMDQYERMVRENTRLNEFQRITSYFYSDEQKAAYQRFQKGLHTVLCHAIRNGDVNLIEVMLRYAGIRDVSIVDENGIPILNLLLQFIAGLIKQRGDDNFAAEYPSIHTYRGSYVAKVREYFLALNSQTR